MTMPTGRLAGKTALITGASSGLGRAIAHAYAREGAQVCCVDLYPSLRNAVNPTTGAADSVHNRISTGTLTHEGLRAAFGGEHFFVRADVTQAKDVEAAVAACVEAFGRLDILVNNAGVSVESQHTRELRVHETEEGEYDTTMGINAKGIFLGCKYAVAQMLKQEMMPWPGSTGGEGGGGSGNSSRGERGCIINTASVQGLLAYYGTPSYCASKGAAVQLTKQVALDYAPDKIRCNAICPGFLTTAMTQNLQNDPEAYQHVAALHPLGGFGTPEDIAGAAVFLASEEARWITGVPLPVDGGYMCQ